MSDPPFLSYAQNAEDVVLWRALRAVTAGRYVDIGANHPEHDSVTKAFYDRGWSGLDVEPVSEYATALRAARPRDVVLEVAVSSEAGQASFQEFPGTGLSTLRTEYVAEHVDRGHVVRERQVSTCRLDDLVEEHLPGEEIHFCKIDVEGAEGAVLASVDLTTWRPWVLVVEATRPNTTEPTHDEWEAAVLAAGYRFCLFDGLSRFYVSEERAGQLQTALSYPACSLDRFAHAAALRVQEEIAVDRVETALRAARQEHEHTVRGLDEELTTLRAELVRWRGAVLDRWARAATAAPVADDAARQELDAVRRTLSWRVTAPLRAVRTRQRRTTR